MGGGPAPGEVGQAPGAGLSLAVDVGHLPLPLSAHDELGVVLEVVDLEEGYCCYSCCLCLSLVTT